MICHTQLQEGQLPVSLYSTVVIYATQSRRFHICVWSRDPFLALHLASKIKFLVQPDHLTLHGIKFSTTIDSAFDKLKGMRYMHNDEEWLAVRQCGMRVVLSAETKIG